MKNKITLLMTLLLLCTLLLACSFNAGYDADDSDTKAEKTTKKEKKKKKDMDEEEGSDGEDYDESEEDSVEETKADVPDPKSKSLINSVRPEGNSKPVTGALGGKSPAQQPSGWIYIYNSRKGYGFFVPEGSTGEWGRVNNVDTFAGATPDGVGIFVFAWKDRRSTRESLLDDAEKTLNAMGETVTTGEIVGSSDLYAVAEGSSVDGDGVQSSLKVLVGTDVTDNYVMIVGTDANEYQSKINTIDSIWGSFEMWSGGGGGR